jgi:hypothetical protein
MIKGKRLAAAATALSAICAATGAQAVSITVGGAELVAPDRSEDFGNGAALTGVTNEFASSGITFASQGGLGMAVANTATCPNGPLGVADAYLYFGIGAPCNPSATEEGVLMSFDAEVSELSWTGFFRGNGTTLTLEALLGGSVVGTLSLDSGDNFDNETILFSGGTFDQVRFTEASADDLLLGMDDMRWNIAPAAVPIPPTLPLLGAGLLGLAAIGRRSRRET